MLLVACIWHFLMNLFFQEKKNFDIPALESISQYQKMMWMGLTNFESQKTLVWTDDGSCYSLVGLILIVSPLPNSLSFWVTFVV